MVVLLRQDRQADVYLSQVRHRLLGSQRKQLGLPAGSAHFYSIGSYSSHKLVMPPLNTRDRSTWLEKVPRSVAEVIGRCIGWVLGNVSL